MNENSCTINADRCAARLRSKAIDLRLRRVRLANLLRTKQAVDISHGINCKGFGRIHHFKDTPIEDWIRDPLPMTPASTRLGIATEKLSMVQVFQCAVCNFRCWFCYVDYELLDADEKRSALLSASELLDLFLAEKNRPKIIDLSGGQPDIVPEWAIWIMKELKNRKLDNEYYLWLDDNLSLFYSWNYLSSSDFEIMRNYKNFGRVGCLKGISEKSFHENTHADPKLFRRQLEVLGRWVKMGLDQYGYIVFTSESIDSAERSIESLLDCIQKNIHENFPLRLVPLKIREFGPTSERITPNRAKALENQNPIMKLWVDALHRRFSRNEMEKPISDINIS